MRKLIFTICMLLIASSMLGTSTYAWFTMNRNVSATGMTVKAKGEGGILIDRTIYGPNWTTDMKKALSSVTQFGSATVQSLLPTSTSNCIQWYHAEAENDSEHTAKFGSYEVLNGNTHWVKTNPASNTCGFGEVVVESETNYYFIYDNITVLPNNASTSFNKLWITRCSVETTDANQSLSKSLRVAVVCGGYCVILAPISDATTTYNVNGSQIVNVVDSSDSATIKIADTYDTAIANKVILSDNDNLEKCDLSVYIYYEGEDENHFTDNFATAVASASGIANLTISLSFQCETVNVI